LASGIKMALGEVYPSALEWGAWMVDFANNTLANVMGETAAKIVGQSSPLINPKGIEIMHRTAEWMRSYADSITVRESNIYDIPEGDGFLDTARQYFIRHDGRMLPPVFEMNRAFATFMEGAPVTIPILAVFAMNPKLGFAMMTGVEGGSVFAQIEKYEEEGGEVPAAYKLMAPAIVGSFNAYLEKFALERILRLGRTMGDHGMKKRLFEVGMAGINNALITGTQSVATLSSEWENFQDLAEGKLPNGWEKSFMEGFYSGGILGMGLSGGVQSLTAIKHGRPNDITLTGFEMVDGRYEPRFRVNKPGHPLERQIVGLDALTEIQQDSPVTVPNWRRARLKQEIIDALPNEEHVSLKAEYTLRLFDAYTSQLGYASSDAFIGEHNVVVKKGGTVEKGDLLQVDGFHGSPYDFAKFSSDYIGTGEGAQAFGWGLYFSQSKGIAKDYARRLSETLISINSVPINNLAAIRKGVIESSKEIRDIFSKVDSFTELAAIVDLETAIREIMDHMAGDAGSFAVVRSDIVDSWRDVVSRADNPTFKESGNLVIKALESIDPSTVTIQNPGIVYEVTLMQGHDIGDYRWLPWRDQITANDFILIRDGLLKRDAEALREGDAFRSEQIKETLRQMEPAFFQSPTTRTEAQVYPVGSEVYTMLAEALGGDKAASLFLDSVGIVGTVYNAIGGKSAYANYLIFNDANITIKQKETLYQRGKERVPKGSFSVKDGAMVMNFFEAADFSTLLHEMSHLFFRTLPDAQLAEANKIWQVSDGTWTVETHEQFARGFERWLAEGGPSDFKGSNIFRLFKRWMLEIYSKAANIAGVEMSDAHVSFYESMFDLTVLEIEKTPEPGRTNKLAEWFSSFYEWWDVEHGFRKIGFAETGFHNKNYFSTQGAYQTEAINTSLSIARAVRSNAGKDSDAVLLSERSDAIEEIRNKPESERTDVEKAALVLREYFDQSAMEYEARGIKINFKSRLIAEINEKIAKAASESEAGKLTKLLEQLTQAEALEFVHIPTLMWFRTLMAKSPDRAHKLLITMAATRHKRKTFTIQSMIDAGAIQKNEVRSADILASYGKNKGTDFALSNILLAALQEEAALPKSFGIKPKNFKEPTGEMRLFSDYYIHSTLYHWIDTQLVDNSKPMLIVFRNAINATKMWAFWNPLFLPMYDVLQANQAGAMNVLRPIKTSKQFYDATVDVLNYTEKARLADINGVQSTPFNSPVQQVAEEVSIANRMRVPAHAGPFAKSLGWALARGEHALADIVDKTFKGGPTDFISQLGGVRPLIRNTYQASWSTAWFLDRIVRQVTYNHFHDNLGFTPREAAQEAALIHADYAAVPPSTRKHLNTIFFTPTFKIAMGKWMVDSIRGMGNVLANDATLTHKQKASVFVRTLALITGFDMLMMSFDFDRDSFGRRYSKTVDTDTGPREMVINWTGPFNLFLKYAQRLYTSFTDPAVTNPIARFMQENSWELTPLWRIATSVVSNTTPGGDKIYYWSDDPSIKLGKLLMYTTTSAVNILQNLVGEDDFGKDGREAFAREYGQLIDGITAPFIFKYTRQPAEIRLMEQINMVLRIHDEEVEGNLLQREVFRKGRDATTVIDEFIHGKGPFHTPLEERSKNLARRLEELLNNYMEEHYDISSPEVSRLYQDVDNPDTPQFPTLPPFEETQPQREPVPLSIFD
jgi:hypothetical protein